MRHSFPPAAAAFALGLALGSVAGSWGQRAMFHRMMRNGSDPRRAIERVSKDLSLDASQKAAVSSAFESKKQDVEKLKADTFARLASIRASSDAEIEKVLRPEQLVKFEALRRARHPHVNWEEPPPAR